MIELWSCLRDRRPDYLAHARRLYDLLFAPVRTALDAQGINVVQLSLDGSLRFVPFAALHEGHDFAVAHFAFLVRTATMPRPMTAAPSGRCAYGLGSGRAAAGLPALPFVRSELGAVIRTEATPNGVLPGIISYDDEFSANALSKALSGRYDVVHIASHFVFRPGRERDSWLLLGDGSRLGVEELLAMPFDGVELVALSACETAVGAGRRDRAARSKALPRC